MTHTIIRAYDPRKLMWKETYDPDDDGVIAIANTEADMKKADWDTNSDDKIDVAKTEADMTKAEYDPNNYGFPVVGTYIPSDDLLAQDETEKTTVKGDWECLYEFVVELGEGIPIAYGLRIKWEMKAGDANGVQAMVARNGVQISDIKSTTDITNYVAFQVDVGSFRRRDRIQLWVKSGSTSYESYVRNFKICGAFAVKQVKSISFTQTV